MLSAIQPENQFTLQESVALYKQLLTTIIEYEMQSDPVSCLLESFSWRIVNF